MDRSNLTASDNVGPGILLCMHKNKRSTSVWEKVHKYNWLYMNPINWKYLYYLSLPNDSWIHVARATHECILQIPNDNFHRTEAVLRVHWSTAHYIFVVKSFRNSGPPSSQQPPITKKSFAAPDLSPRSQKMSRRQKSTVVCLTQIPINDWAVE